MDYYVYQPFRSILKNKTHGLQKGLKIAYWSLPVLVVVGAIVYPMVNDWDLSRYLRYSLMTVFLFNYAPKLFVSIFLLIHDFIGLMSWVVKNLHSRAEHRSNVKNGLTRSEFISKAALISATAPIALLGFGIVKGAHDYRVIRRRIVLPDLPKSFDGIKIGHLSDIHTGSFFNRMAVKGGIDLFMAEKPDVIFFTGDLVNNATSEVNEYIDLFAGLKAPLGIFSVTGNHDYGDYSRWPNQEAKDRNFKDLMKAHELMGFDLLMNENRKIELGGERLGIIGIENWGAGRFQKYGDLDKAYKGSEEAPVKLLLSHDPSHWDAQVRPKYPDIDVMFAGHTHGFQFGVEIGDFKWSPAQYLYKQWADMYQQDSQYLYVNRGFGFIGYPGRIGIAPELTIIELSRQDSVI